MARRKTSRRVRARVLKKPIKKSKTRKIVRRKLARVSPKRAAKTRKVVRRSVTPSKLRFSSGYKIRLKGRTPEGGIVHRIKSRFVSSRGRKKELSQRFFLENVLPKVKARGKLKRTGRVYQERVSIRVGYRNSQGKRASRWISAFATDLESLQDEMLSKLDSAKFYTRENDGAEFKIQGSLLVEGVTYERVTISKAAQRKTKTPKGRNVRHRNK